MATIYNNPLVYDMFETEGKNKATHVHWETVFAEKNINSVLDISIGTGSLTLPIAEMGKSLFGSDISFEMLSRCREKAEQKNINIDLRQCDFRNLINTFDRKFDCVMSTGNSLPHVNNSDVCDVSRQMDLLINDGGYLYLDMRNWDMILDKKERFYLYAPVYKDDLRINAVQVWDYNTDGSMTFNILYTYEKDNKIVKKELFVEHYFPISLDIIKEKLYELGYAELKLALLPAQYGEFDMRNSGWYCLIAQKK